MVSFIDPAVQRSPSSSPFLLTHYAYGLIDWISESVILTRRVHTSNTKA